MEWAKQVGLIADLSARGLGVRIARFALILDDLVVKYLGVCAVCRDIVEVLKRTFVLQVEPAPGAVTVSGADVVLSKL